MREKITDSYYIGLDVGSSSAGWAVTDTEYNLLKSKGQVMWGVRLFPEANNAADRRSHRTARRRLARRKQRLAILEMLFSSELSAKDPGFIIRMRESSLWPEDKSGNSKYSLFADPDFTDCEYHTKYPTIYHLRSELAHSKEPHDVRLVYLALHHLIKNRGHFLYEMSETSDSTISLDFQFDKFCNYIQDNYDVDFAPQDRTAYLAALQQSDISITDKAKELCTLYGKQSKDKGSVSTSCISELLAGKSVSLARLFSDDTLKNAEKISLKNDLDEKYDILCEVLGERAELLVAAKAVYDAAHLSQILGGHTYISDAKKALYEQNKLDLLTLKKYVKENHPAEYKHIFCEKGNRKTKLDNYAAYSQYHHISGEYICKQEDFCKFLRKTLPQMKENSKEEVSRIYRKIEDDTFLPRLRSSDNGVIPYQLQKAELQSILKNASEYLPFLRQLDSDGLTITEKIIQTFEFRIPYYVGPLNQNAAHQWAVRMNPERHEKVYPWNFDRIIDRDQSAKAFLENLVGRCTYTGEPVLPKDSLLYSEFALLNEINPLKINGYPLDIAVKKQMIEDLFVHPNFRGKVTKKRIYEYLLSKGLIEKTDIISGIDDKITSDLRSLRDFSDILTRTHDRALVECIIKAILIFGNDKKMLRRWIRKKTNALTDQEIQYICRLKYTGWGRLSETFLTQIYSAGEYGEAKNIMDMLRDTNANLMQLLSDQYAYAANAESYRNQLFGNNQTLSEKLDAMYIAPAVRRSIRQTLRIVDEIVKLRGAPPKKIFIEMARDNRNELKKKRTESRKDKLLALYRDCPAQYKELRQQLEKEDDNHLRRDALYLYYTQFGRCMYSGEIIDLEALLRGEQYDVDHIFPQSRIKDDSIDNRVLVKNVLNREKDNRYPIDETIRQKMQPHWELLKQRKLISGKKFDRLTRSTPLTEEELSAFVARQLTQTQQSTKALTLLLKERYGDSTQIVFSKAGNVSDFRHEFNLIKCREINDLHHAKDAYLNIVVGNVYDTKFTKRFFANILNEEYSLKRVFEFNTPGAWVKDVTIATVRRCLAKNNALVTRMPYEQKGELFDLQLKPAGEGQLEKKQGLGIQKYGGYNKRAAAYYFAVEFTRKKKRVRALQPVFLYKKDLYESNPLEYCKSILQLDAPVIIRRKILIDALLDLDGKRLFLSSRTGDNIIYEHSYQLSADADRAKYIKNIAKYVERCNAHKCELPVTKYDDLSSVRNIDLFDWFLEKCEQRVYAEFEKTMKDCLKNNREKFISMTTLEQSKLLLEMLKAFQSNAQNTNLKAIGGGGTVARISKSCNLSNFQSVYLIDQSITGLYEHKVNLLK